MNEEKISGTLQVTGTINGTITIGGGSAPVLQEVTVKSNPNEQQVITPPEGVDGFSKVIVRKRPLATKVIKPKTTAQTYSAWDEDHYGYREVTVDAVHLQVKQVTPSSVQQVVTPDTGWDGLSQITVDRVTDTIQGVLNGTITSVTMQDSGSHACYGLYPMHGQSLTLPNTVTSIEDEAFRNIDIFGTVVAPSVQSIGLRSFVRCNTLTDLYLGYNGVVTVSTVSFASYSGNLTVHVPSDQLASYQSDSDWADESSAITTAGGSLTFVGDYA